MCRPQASRTPERRQLFNGSASAQAAAPRAGERKGALISKGGDRSAALKEQIARQRAHLESLKRSR